MKLIAPILAASACCCFSLLAQEPSAPAAPKPPGAQLALELGLNPEQQAKVKEINKAQREKVMALKENTALSKDERRAQAKAIQEANAAAMKEVLTPEQFQKWLSIRDKAIAAAREKAKAKAATETAPQ